MMSLGIDKTGIFLSKPISLLFVLIYLAQSALLIYMIRDRYELEKVIDYQRSRIYDMEEKLKIFKVIEDFQIGYSDKEKGDLTAVIFEESKRYNYDPFLIMAVILSESSFKKGIVSEQGALGAMQLMPVTGRDLAVKSGIGWQGANQLSDPSINVRLGMMHLFSEIMKFKDVKKGLIAYNLGETQMEDRLKSRQPLPRQYFLRIWDNYKMLKAKYDI
jgi:soluble lytic murein transglycosylase